MKYTPNLQLFLINVHESYVVNSSLRCLALRLSFFILFLNFSIAGAKPGSSPIFNIALSPPPRKTVADDFLNSDNDKNDYDW